MAKRFRRGSYPWLRWFSMMGSTFRLSRGVDFSCSTHSMAQQLRNMAPSYGVKHVSILIEGDDLNVQLGGEPRRGRHA